MQNKANLGRYFYKLALDNKDFKSFKNMPLIYSDVKDEWFNGPGKMFGSEC